MGSVPVTEEMNAEKFRVLASTAIEEINRRGKLAIVVGGSGLYIKALTHGLAPLPAVDPKLRAELNALSLEELNARLAAVDPSGAKKIDQQNKRRVVQGAGDFRADRRAGFRATVAMERTAPQNAAAFCFCAIASNSIHASINGWRRCFATALRRKSPRLARSARPPPRPLVSTKSALCWQEKQVPSECLAAIQQATRRYAKRQLTWFRRQTNLEPLNLSLLKDHAAAVDWILQKVSLLPPLE